MKKGRILYVGPFIMPDGNAAAHRVLQNAKIFNICGFYTTFVELRNGDKEVQEDIRKFCDYNIWKIKYKSKKDRMWKEKAVIEKIIEYYGDVVAIMGYNLPSTVTMLIMNICKKNSIKYLVDCTEWYSTKHMSFFKKPFFALDNFLTMRILNKKADGIIVISTYLENYYKTCKNVIRIPPLVDKEEGIWNNRNKKDNNVIRFIFSGTLRKGKDNLKSCIDSIKKVDNAVLDIYGVTEEEYYKVYNIKKNEKNEKIIFHGFVSHNESISAIKNADYMFLIREASRKNNAGFSTKLVESISAGTAVVGTDTSDLRYLIDRYSCGYIIPYKLEEMEKGIEEIAKKPRIILTKECTELFDYRNYVKNIKHFLKSV
ncbi:glycosyltransferase [Clostridium perfringens]|uniref:glycosyltransferase n=1 Tax=Clostridium perfringens TaxID=1502 RepID=UPI002A64019C|nr:glycosyltransferase [Clostridium perfringens]MDJ8932647.1 glycosyltransferase [Clostridium perfringens]MDJ8938529.1 glycosyltransferase [Clostridium perfringens]MDJ8941502.1 glycosyltransferase [Clostridium perfringens]